jgi:protocatechuate 4,5-dioxygenase beta chain
MAKIIAGVGCSHVPAIGAALDLGKTEDPYWKPVFDGFAHSREIMAKLKPDVVIEVYNDHGSAFSLQYIPTFCLGVASEFQPADEGWGPRPVPVVKGDPDFAWHLVESLILNDFDMTIVNEMEVDHGLTVPLSLMFGQVKEWPCPVIPLPVNVVTYPPPSGKRCFALGRAIKKAVEEYPKDMRVIVFGTGGMSHQIHGERCGLINTEFDTTFLDGLTKDPQKLAQIEHKTYVTEGGAESIELVMWHIMRGSLEDNAMEAYRFYHVPASNTAVGNIILTNLGTI